MGLEIFNGDNKNYVFKEAKNDVEKIDLIQVQKNDEIIEKKVIKPQTLKMPKPSSSKNKNKITKENKEFLNSLKSGAGFKIIPKPSN